MFRLTPVENEFLTSQMTILDECGVGRRHHRRALAFER